MRSLRAKSTPVTAREARPGAGARTPGIGRVFVSVLLLALWSVGVGGNAVAQVKFWPDEAHPAPSAPLLITNLAQLRGLDQPAAAQKIPVLLQATVTFCEDQWPTLFVQDGDHAAYVYRPKGTIPLAAGDRIEIQRQSGEGFSPLIDASAIRKVGVSDLPPPIFTTLEELGTGRYDGLRVRLITAVRWMHVTYRRLYLHIGAGQCHGR